MGKCDSHTAQLAREGSTPIHPSPRLNRVRRAPPGAGDGGLSVRSPDSCFRPSHYSTGNGKYFSFWQTKPSLMGNRFGSSVSKVQPQPRVE